MTAILFGSIGSLADTSELQREAFNEAFTQHGLDWEWSQEEYRRLLADSGGAKRIAAYAQERNEDVDAAAVHQTKSEIFQRKLRDTPPEPRPGVVETIESAEREGFEVALVTTTTPENVAALGDALRPRVDIDRFALILDTTDVDNAKPAPDAYEHALRRLGETAESVVAIEDNAGGVRSAVAAHIPVVAFPGENNADHDYDAAGARVDHLELGSLQSLLATA